MKKAAEKDDKEKRKREKKERKDVKKRDRSSMSAEELLRLDEVRTSFLPRNNLTSQYYPFLVVSINIRLNNDTFYRSFGFHIELATYTRLVIASSINKVGVY